MRRTPPLPGPLPLADDSLPGAGREAYFPPTYSGRKVNTALRTAMGNLSIPEASRFSPPGFRRGAAQQLKTTGSQWPTVAASGFWQSLAFKGYIDLTADVARDMSKLLSSSFASDSDEDIPGTLRLFTAENP